MLEFTHDLPATDDYKPRTEVIPAPEGLKPGFYYLIVSHAQDFGATANSVNYTDFWVSDLALVSRSAYGNPEVAGMVTDNRSGDPVQGAKVQVWTRGNNGGWTAGETGTTDKNGLYAIGTAPDRAHLVVVAHKDQQLASAHDQYTYRAGRQEGAGEQTVFFTDRSLYRPGQTIQFKGISIHFNHRERQLRHRREP